MAIILNVALPPITRNTGSKYAFADLTVDGPALVEPDAVVPSKVASRLQSALAAARKRNPELKDRKFRIRVFQIEGKDAVGVWRVA